MVRVMFKNNQTRRIELDGESFQKIKKAFGVSDVTMRHALNYTGGTRAESATAKRIRKMAMKLGGCVMVTAPECETIHVHGERHEMVQRFPNGALIVVDFQTGDGVLKDAKGVERLRKQDMAVQELEAMQRVAARL